jgi:hypothetical protein
MNISRGFRRLSILVGLIGFVAIVLIWLGHDIGPTVDQIILGLAFFVGAPVILVLALGWVIAGFQKSN